MGYSEIQIEKMVFHNGIDYSFGSFNLHLRFLTLEVFQNEKLLWSSPIDESFLACGSSNYNIDAFEDSFYLVDDNNWSQLCKK